jgi:hypothetical protein
LISAAEPMSYRNYKGDGVVSRFSVKTLNVKEAVKMTT